MIKKSEQKIYHGCFLKNKGATNKLIEKGKNCISATTNLFWKYLEDIQPGVSTRSQERNQKKVKKKLILISILNKKTLRMARSGRFGDCYFKAIRRILYYMVKIIICLILIINNGNILTDGRRYRRRSKFEF